MEKVKKLKHFNYEFKVNFTVASKGQNKWFVLKYEPLIEDRIELSPDDHTALKVFQGIIKEENEFVVDKMRDNVGSSVAAEFVQDITPGE